MKAPSRALASLYPIIGVWLVLVFTYVPLVLSKDLSTEEKMKRIVLPQVEFQQTPIHDCLAALAEMSEQFDPSDNPTGIHLVVNVLEGRNSTITLRLTNVPLAEAIRLTASLANATYEIQDGVVEIVPIRDPDDKLITKAYQIPADVAEKFLQVSPSRIFVEQGITVGDGASTIFDESESILVIKNYEEQLLQAENYLATMIGHHPVSIDAVSIRQLKKKLENITIPRVEFWETPLMEALEFIQTESMKHDPEKHPDKKGINLILDVGPELAEQKSSLILTDASLEETLQHLIDLNELRYDLKNNTVVITPKQVPPAP
ncbi:MAG: hypothetical protein AAGA96_18670 [Verrucomicrobiota bacterium]